MISAESPPSDYRLLVPRDWFRVDLTHDRWRRQLKTFVDKESQNSGLPAEVAREIWTSLRNTVEVGLGEGALEFFLRTEMSESSESAAPASLLVALALTPKGLAPQAAEFGQVLRRRVGDAAEVDVVTLPAGATVRVRTDATVDYHVRMPGAVGYLHLAFSLPVSGVRSPMGELCDAMAHSLRWV
ncbi:hypothetical protein ELQ87_16585 [Streptomyces griseoviridis]|uniref:DUF2867 domain-containing protein n=2 Tax=Streptomyces griseoviridis TaxID=45398 RepID=A0A3S9ZD25_STRGD|nr:hypothetical protein [Streptomyces griseoviridis]AZS85738.1 hypothetical protein ELQ87_16585 [Streptomyces griseoviridis]QCN87412.1 hypothetical protein DDJ31_22695 [Streptomyces griseoviridis]